MKYLKFSISMMIGIPMGIIAFIGVAAGCCVGAFLGGYSIMTEAFLDKLTEWIDV